MFVKIVKITIIPVLPLPNLILIDLSVKNVLLGSLIASNVLTTKPVTNVYLPNMFSLLQNLLVSYVQKKLKIVPDVNIVHLILE